MGAKELEGKLSRAEFLLKSIRSLESDLEILKNYPEVYGLAYEETPRSCPGLRHGWIANIFIDTEYHAEISGLIKRTVTPFLIKKLRDYTTELKTLIK